MTYLEKDPTMSTESLSAFKFASSYGRYLPDLKRREVPSEAFERVVEMHRQKYAGQDIEAELGYCLAAMKDGLVLGSQRALQFGGSPILRRNERMYNCSSSYCDRPRFFQETLWLLLCGCGAGFSVQRHHVAKLPPMVSPRASIARTFVIPDTCEGWADAVGVLMASYGIVAPEIQGWVGVTAQFDFSEIRAKGSQISSGSGKAPGPEPLRLALEQIRGVLQRRYAMGVPGEDVYLRPIDAYDVVMHASDAVLAGGVRRSATLCMFSADDAEMMNAKTGDWQRENPQRGRSNNSAVLLRQETTWEQFNDIFMQARRQYGEPGFVWADNTEITYNPCVEIGLYPAITKKDMYQVLHGETWRANGHGSAEGEETSSGWAFCNLCEINSKACKTEADWLRAARAAAILGTLQAGYTTFPYLGNVSEAIARREALLGVSMTGMMDNPKFAFDPAFQRYLAAEIIRVNAEFAPRIGVRPTARATCVKPAGSTSCILGTSSGIHAHHARRYFRRAQANEMEAPLQFYEMHNPEAVERSVWSKSGTDRVVTFCIEVAEAALTRRQVDGLKQLEFVKLTQENWVQAGTVVSRCAQPWLRHNVSNTISIHADQQAAAARYIYENRDSFAGVSILDASGDLDYVQAPFCEVRYADELLADYGDGVFFASGLIVDGLHAFGNNLWLACDAALGITEIKAPEYPGRADLLPTAIKKAYDEVYTQKKDWVRRAHQFASRYFGFEPGDLKKVQTAMGFPMKSTKLAGIHAELEKARAPLLRMTYCLKEVSNLKRWNDLTRQHQPVDFTKMIEAEDGTVSVVLDVACAGGACALQMA
jgi:ribonucleoside-triphosphate reductase